MYLLFCCSSFYLYNSTSIPQVQSEHWYVLNGIALVREQASGQDCRTVRVTVTGGAWHEQNYTILIFTWSCDLWLLGEKSWIWAFGQITIIIITVITILTTIIIIPRSLYLSNLLSVFSATSLLLLHHFHQNGDIIIACYRKEADFYHFPEILPKIQSENRRCYLPSHFSQRKHVSSSRESLTVWVYLYE